jgi:uncharacterized membrane protein
MNILCISSIVVLISGLVTWALSNKRRTLYRPVDASERPDRAIDPYEIAREHRRKLTKKNMTIWGVMAGIIMLVSFTWQVAVMTLAAQ